jgi:hypothetical protein
MRFGKQHLGPRLVLARIVAYCQAAVLVLVAVNLLEILLIGGSTSGLSFQGAFATTSVSGNRTVVTAFALFVVAVVLILVEQRAAGDGGARRALAVVEAVFAIGFVGFVAAALGGWLFGPAAALIVVGLHYWPELRAYFFADKIANAASEGAEPPALPLDTPAPPMAPPFASPTSPSPAISAAGAGTRETAPPHL